jgi:hypothetical protein
MRKILILTAATVFSMCLSINVMAGTWKKDSNGWWYDYGNGSFPKSGWEWIDDDGDSYAESYYFNDKGYILTNTVKDGYKINPSGAWIDSMGQVQKKEIKAPNKKGLAVTNLDNNHAAELGVSNIIWNNTVIHDYSPSLRASKARGVSNTVIMLNPWQTSDPALLPVSAPQSGAVFYGFNTQTEAGRQELKKTAEKYAKSYSDCVDSWVIGNEINNGNTWNFMPNRELDSYTKQYADAFRIWYEAIKKENPNAKVYIPFDYRWNWYSDQGYGYLQASHMLPILNEQLKDTEYGIAWHAYPEDLKDPDFTDDASVKDNFSTPIINMKNIAVLTDFMQQSDYLDPKGKVRSIILSEQGFNAVSDDKQAKMIEEAYNIAKNNPYIETFYLNRENDLGEIHMGNEMRFGLIDRSGNKRKSFEVYKNLK